MKKPIEDIDDILEPLREFAKAGSLEAVIAIGAIEGQKTEIERLKKLNTRAAENSIMKQKRVKDLEVALDGAISDLHYMTVPYEEHQPIIGEELWRKLAEQKSALIAVLNPQTKEK